MMDNPDVKNYLMRYVRMRRREISLESVGSDGQEDGDHRPDQVASERQQAYEVMDEIRRAVDRSLTGAERDIILERYLTPVPIRNKGRLVGWRLQTWESISDMCGYSCRHTFRLHRSALAHLQAVVQDGI